MPRMFRHFRLQANRQTRFALPLETGPSHRYLLKPYTQKTPAKDCSNADVLKLDNRSTIERIRILQLDGFHFADEAARIVLHER